jgi:hypothetical protein
MHSIKPLAAFVLVLVLGSLSARAEESLAVIEFSEKGKKAKLGGVSFAAESSKVYFSHGVLYSEKQWIGLDSAQKKQGCALMIQRTEKIKGREIVVRPGRKFQVLKIKDAGEGGSIESRMTLKIDPGKPALSFHCMDFSEEASQGELPKSPLKFLKSQLSGWAQVTPTPKKLPPIEASVTTTEEAIE